MYRTLTCYVYEMIKLIVDRDLWSHPKICHFSSKGIYSLSPAARKALILLNDSLLANSNDADDNAIAMSTGEDDGADVDLDFNSEPSPRAPRLHCIVFHRLGSGFPLLIQPSDGSCLRLTGKCNGHFSPWLHSEALPSTILEDSRRTREAVIGHISKALGRDPLAAEYILLGLLSRIILRQEALLLGIITVSLDGLHVCDRRLAALQAAIADIVPRYLKVISL
jgi:hypothetical protein